MSQVQLPRSTTCARPSTPARRAPWTASRRQLAVQQRGHRGSSTGGVGDVVAGHVREVRLRQVDPNRVVRRLAPEQRMAVVVDDRDRREVEGHDGGRIST
jgi:hypothetical protein